MLTAITKGELMLLQGNIVLVDDENKPRGQWRLAVSSSPGKMDTLVVQFYMYPTVGVQARFKRPLQHLYPLEVATLSPHVQQGTAESNLESGSTRQPVEAGLRSVNIRNQNGCDHHRQQLLKQGTGW
jgi:hypothetical protein